MRISTPKNMKLYSFVGVKIKSLRKEKNWTQDDIALLLGFTRVSVFNMESGKHRLTIDSLMKYCAIFGCTPNDLLPAVPKANVRTSKEMVTRVVKVKVKKGRPLKASFKW